MGFEVFRFIYTYPNFPISILRVSVNALIFTKNIYTNTININSLQNQTWAVGLIYINSIIIRDNVLF